jgi:N-acetyl-anhydromuramoyl-L-alanine amidase
MYHWAHRPASRGRVPVTLRVHLATGLLEGVRQVLSPHHDARPEGMPPDLVVIHNISLPPAQFGGPWIEKLFNGQLPPDVHPYFATVHSARVSAHVLVRRDGEIVQFVPFHRRAWHAGASQYEGRSACNDFSIGIEIEGTDDIFFEDAQYDATRQVILAVTDAYPELSTTRVVGHSDIAPGRKTDPGPAFDWARLPC